VFRRILVALDGSEAARAAFVFATEWARHFDAQVWFIQLADESARRRCGIETDVKDRGRRLANQFTVSGATQGVRNQQLVAAVTEAAHTHRADLIMVGFDRRRLTHARFSRSLQDQLTEATCIPVMLAPKELEVGCRRVDVQARRAPAIALGPATAGQDGRRGAERLVHV
jgi:K+-sensing histidine kinase KdpD